MLKCGQISGQISKLGPAPYRRPQVLKALPMPPSRLWRLPIHQAPILQCCFHQWLKDIEETIVLLGKQHCIYYYISKGQLFQKLYAKIIRY